MTDPHGPTKPERPQPHPGAPGTGDGAGDDVRPDEPSAEARVLRRAILVGLTVGGVVAALGVVGVLVSDMSGAMGMAALLVGVIVGALVAAAWLLLSVLFDLLAGRSPHPRRLWWGLGLAVLAFVTPVLLLGALSAATS